MYCASFLVKYDVFMPAKQENVRLVFSLSTHYLKFMHFKHGPLPVMYHGSLDTRSAMKRKEVRNTEEASRINTNQI